MKKLRYPADLDTNKNDFVQFVHYPYRVNDALRGNSGIGGGGTGSLTGGGGQPQLPLSQIGRALGYTRPDHSKTPPRKEGAIIQLYMPNTTPPVQQVQDWKSTTFTGEKGQLTKQLYDFAADAMSAPTPGDPGAAGQQRMFRPGAFAQQFILDALTSQLGADANAAMQLGRGKVFNPNVEMMYKMPQHRKFNFDFNFIPKSREDTLAADAIIKEFKTWSSPGLQAPTHLIVPDIWLVTYFQAGGKQHSRMNPWKPAVLESVQTQDNPLSDLHMTIADETGDVPVHTVITMSFCETDIVTRVDHEKAIAKGYKRGH